MFKDLGGSGAVRARPGGEARLPATTRCARSRPTGRLAPAALGTAGFYGAVVDPDAGPLLALHRERPRSRALADRRARVWEQAGTLGCGPARPLRRTHDIGPAREHLLRYDADLYRLWLRRALEFADRWEARRPGARKTIEWLAERYDPVVERSGRPSAHLHPRRVLRLQRAGRQRGRRDPRLPDRLGERRLGARADRPRGADDGRLERRRAGARWQPLPGGCRRRRSSSRRTSETARGLDCARLHLAVQWLGWAPDWTPPRSAPARLARRGARRSPRRRCDLLELIPARVRSASADRERRRLRPQPRSQRRRHRGARAAASSPAPA